MLKAMILFAQLQNDNGTGFNTAKPISSYMCRNLYIILLLTFFRSDLPLFSFLNLFNSSDPPLPNYKKIDEELVNEFL